MRPGRVGEEKPVRTTALPDLWSLGQRRTGIQTCANTHPGLGHMFWKDWEDAIRISLIQRFCISFLMLMQSVVNIVENRIRHGSWKLNCVQNKADVFGWKTTWDMSIQSYTRWIHTHTNTHTNDGRLPQKHLKVTISRDFLLFLPLVSK